MENGKIIKKIIFYIILLILIVIMIYSGVNIIIWVKENKESSEIKDSLLNFVFVDTNSEFEESNLKETIDVDFKSLKQINSDVVAWIKVKGTNIEYPVLKTINNDFYMSHSFDKKNNSAGWIFMDYKNKLDSTDKNIVIFGHNRKDTSMFGTLKNILTNEWQNDEENFIIPFITENKKEEYRVFSVYSIEKEDYYITTNFKDDSEFEDFINKITLRSFKNFNVNVTKDDQILTLSTCADNNNYRVVLHAKKIVD